MIDYQNDIMVSFDVAKKLKELQFSEETLYHYIFDKDKNIVNLVTFGTPKKNLEIHRFETFCAPSQSYILKKFRNDFEIFISVVPIIKDGKVWYLANIYDINPECQDETRLLSKTKNLRETPEESVNDAIIEVLENFLFFTGDKLRFITKTSEENKNNLK